MLTESLFTIAKTRKQPKCLLVDERIKKMWSLSTYIYNGIFSHTKNEILPSVTTWMDLGGIMVSEVSLIEKDKCHRISVICYILKKKKTRKQNKQSNELSWIEKTDWWLPKVGRGEMGEKCQKAQIYSYKMKKSWGYNG